ncbi:MAG: DUF6289 family protein [Luteimonas sp.]
MRIRSACILGLAAALAAGSSAAVAPDIGRGDWVRYLDDAGNIVGYHAIHCDGTPEFWGKPTRNAVPGVFLCGPGDT